VKSVLLLVCSYFGRCCDGKNKNSEIYRVFVTGRGGAGFHSPDPALKRGRGGMFRVIPALPPSGAHPHSFPGRGPVCYHLFLTGARLGYGWGGGLRGDRGRECRKRHPAPGRSVGRCGEKGRGPAFFRASSAP